MPDEDLAPEGARNVALMRRYLAAFDAKDKAALLGFVTEDAVIEIPFNESGLVEDENFRKFSGISELSQFYDNAMKAFGPDNHVKMDYLDISEANEGRTIFVECRGGCQMSNGRTYRNRYCMRYDFRDGKIARIREYYNPVATAYAFDRLLAGRYRLEALDPPQ
jgi:ketosteroid isomerase-like protein